MLYFWWCPRVPWVKKCFPVDLNQRPQSRSRRRWFILLSSLLVHSKVLAPVQSRIPSLSVFGWSGALTFGYGCTVDVGVDVGAGDVEVDVIYISFT